MIRVEIGQESIGTLTLLFLRGQLPKGKSGEVFYDYNPKNEIKNIYFKNHEYFKQLLHSIKSLQTEFTNSNASEMYNTLSAKFFSFEEISDDIDYGLLTKYTEVEKNFDAKEIDNTIIQNIDSGEGAFYRDMKRLYVGYDVTYFGSPKFVVIKFEYDKEEKSEFNFDLMPLTELMKAHNIKLEKFNLYRDPRRGLDTVRIGIE